MKFNDLAGVAIFRPKSSMIRGLSSALKTPFTTAGSPAHDCRESLVSKCNGLFELGYRR